LLSWWFKGLMKERGYRIRIWDILVVLAAVLVLPE
jgi:hypothetical protein